MSYKCRLVNPSSDQEIIEKLWYRNMKQGSPRSRFIWLYEDSKPVTEVNSWLVFQNDMPCGCLSILKRDFAYKGQKISGGIAIDIVVDKAHRTIFPAITLLRTAIEGARNLGLQVMLVFPNEKAQPVFSRCGFQKICKPERFSKIINYQSKLTGYLNNNFIRIILSKIIVFSERALLASINGVPFRKIIEVPNSLAVEDTSIGSYNGSDQFYTVKSQDYYVWRYGKNPIKTYQYFSIKLNSNAGSVVYYLESGTAVIEDIYYSDPKVVGLLLYKFGRYLGHAQIDSISFGVSIVSHLKHQLVRAGFFKRMNNRYLLGIDLSSTGLMEAIKDNIVVYDGDMDI